MASAAKPTDVFWIVIKRVAIEVMPVPRWFAALLAKSEVREQAFGPRPSGLLVCSSKPVPPRI
jgi:hypothetical protein